MAENSTTWVCTTCEETQCTHTVNCVGLKYVKPDKCPMNMPGIPEWKDFDCDSIPTMNSTELLMVAHDEWKRREERRHIHPENHWVSGWLNGVGLGRDYLEKVIQNLRECQKINK